MKKIIAVFILTLQIKGLFAQLPSGFSSLKIQEGYITLMGIIFSANGHLMFSWDKAGHVFVSSYDGNGYNRQEKPVLDISEEVGNWGDLGLQSVCLDPDYDLNGFIYLYYCVDRHHLLYSGTPQYDSTANEYYSATISRVTKYRIIPGKNLIADYSSRKVLIGETRKTGIPILYASHMGGTLLFGRDKTLLLSTGDVGSFDVADTGSVSSTFYLQALQDSIIRPAENVGSFRSQLLNGMNGKILRFDRNTGDGIGSNPFYDAENPRSPKSRVWAMGFRNPFRMSVDLASGSTDPTDANPGLLIVGDVGWNNWEEIDAVSTGGLNFGWPLYEGDAANTSFYISNILNKDEFVDFRNLCVQPFSFSIGTNTKTRRYLHTRPILTWNHDISEALVPAFKDSIATTFQLGTVGSPVIGKSFMGKCVIAGTRFSGSEWGEQYRYRYFFADFVNNWIKIADIDSTLNLVNEVADFAPDDFAGGVTCMQMNPADRSIYYTCINTGEIRKIDFKLNRSPAVTIINPVNTAVFSAGSDIEVDVRAIEPEGAIKKVVVFIDGVVWKETSTMPFVFLAPDVPPGTYRLTASAEDDMGAIAYSDTITVYVKKITETGFDAKVSPNPSTGLFNLEIISKSNEPVNMLITDMNGRVMEVKSDLQPNQSTPVGGSLYMPGMYIIEVRQVNTKKKIKILKQ